MSWVTNLRQPGGPVCTTFLTVPMTPASEIGVVERQWSVSQRGSPNFTDFNLGNLCRKTGHFHLTSGICKTHHLMRPGEGKEYHSRFTVLKITWLLPMCNSLNRSKYYFTVSFPETHHPASGTWQSTKLLVTHVTPSTNRWHLLSHPWWQNIQFPDSDVQHQNPK